MKIEKAKIFIGGSFDSEEEFLKDSHEIFEFFNDYFYNEKFQILSNNNNNKIVIITADIRKFDENKIKEISSKFDYNYYYDDNIIYIFDKYNL